MLAVVIVLIIAISLTLKKTVIAPLLNVSEVIRSLAQGDVSVDVRQGGHDEIGQLLSDL